MNCVSTPRAHLPEKALVTAVFSPSRTIYIMQGSDRRGVDKPKRERYHNVSD